MAPIEEVVAANEQQFVENIGRAVGETLTVMAAKKVFFQVVALLNLFDLAEKYKQKSPVYDRETELALLQQHCEMDHYELVMGWVPTYGIVDNTPQSSQNTYI